MLTLSRSWRPRHELDSWRYANRNLPGLGRKLLFAIFDWGEYMVKCLDVVSVVQGSNVVAVTPPAAGLSLTAPDPSLASWEPCAAFESGDELSFKRPVREPL